MNDLKCLFWINRSLKDINFITSKYNLKRIRKIKILIVQGMKLLLQWQEKSFSLYLENIEFSFIQVCTVHQMSLMSIVHMFTLYIKFHNKFSRFQIYKITHISKFKISYLEVYKYIQLNDYQHMYFCNQNQSSVFVALVL